MSTVKSKNVLIKQRACNNLLFKRLVILDVTQNFSCSNHIIVLTALQMIVNVESQILRKVFLGHNQSLQFKLNSVTIAFVAGETVI
jgi:hypothetical protein